MKKLYQYSPPGSPTYSWSELRTTFYTGKVGMTHYAGRVFYETSKYAPDVLEVTGATHMPSPTGKRGPTYSTTGGYVVVKGTKYPDVAKEFIGFMHDTERYPGWLHTVPGHFIPPMKSFMTSRAWLDHPLFKKYPDVMATIISVNDIAYPFSSEWPSEPNPYTSKVAGTLVITDMIQDYILKEMPIDEAVERCVEKIKKLIR
jgi:multiple sugar transport system substrate-binding protein